MGEIIDRMQANGEKMASPDEILKKVSPPHTLQKYIIARLQERSREGPYFQRGISGDPATSAVLFLLSHLCPYGGSHPEACLVLNKRSRLVRQAGDLCFPGGRIASHLDLHLSRLLSLPLLPLWRWPFWSLWRWQRPMEARRLALLFAASLRESFEEMHLNPLGLTFLGPLPSQRLIMFRRIIYPVVGWIRRQRHFIPNWEVEKIVYIPLRDLLDKERYACYRIHFRGRMGDGPEGVNQEYACFVHQEDDQREVLWGATYGIVMVFLDVVFGFRPPPLHSLPVIRYTLDENYYNRSR